MTARVLVVDDLPLNVALLDAILTGAHFQVEKAFGGSECLAKIRSCCPDIVLLDVMMPDMNGFEVCRAIKAQPDLAHLPVVMVTALDQPEDRVAGLQAGADDFLTKPVDAQTLLPRIRNLVRVKMMCDEMLLRASTLKGMGHDPAKADVACTDVLLLIDDQKTTEQEVARILPTSTIFVANNSADALVRVCDDSIELVLLNLNARSYDPIQLTRQLLFSRKDAHVPILAFGDDPQRDLLKAAFEAGVSDFLAAPFDPAELVTRVRTQYRKKRLAQQVSMNVRLSLTAATTDAETGLYNRAFLMRHLENQIEVARARASTLAVLVVRIDEHRRIAEQHGAEPTARLIEALVKCLQKDIRISDLAARTNVDTLTIVMPNIAGSRVKAVAERLRLAMESLRVSLIDGDETQSTISAGIAVFDSSSDDARTIIARADLAAVQAGRNRVETIAA
jgi:two-component system cell cycle response regulator